MSEDEPSATVTHLEPAPLADVQHLIRIQASAEALIEELHQLRSAPDANTRRRLVEIDTALTEQLDKSLGTGLRAEYHRLSPPPSASDVSIDELRIGLAQLEGWLGGLLAGITVAIQTPGPIRKPE
jgi:Bacterial proteasome activator